MRDVLVEFWSAIPKGFVWTTIISVVVASFVSYLFKLSELRRSAEIDYRYEQKKKLNELVGFHHGRLTGTCARFSNRMWNFYNHQDKNWTFADKEYGSAGYYFKSFVFRFMELVSTLREIEKASIHLDTRIAETQNYNFLNYVLAMSWILTDVDLFRESLEGDRTDVDHFYSDNLRSYSDIVCRGGEMPNIESFEQFFGSQSEIRKVLEFFDGVKKCEDRDRWDRLVCFHLIIIAFLDSFGMTRHKSSVGEFRKAARQLSSPKIRKAFGSRITEYDLASDAGLRKLKRALR